MSMETKEITVPAEQFKLRCLELIDEAMVQGVEITVTKNDHPIARVVPSKPELKHRTPKELYGAMAGFAVILGDIVEPIDVEWEVNK